MLCILKICSRIGGVVSDIRQAGDLSDGSIINKMKVGSS